MDVMVVFCLIGSIGLAALSGLSAWLICSRQAAQTINLLTSRADKAETALEIERKSFSDKEAAVTTLETRMRESFAALSLESLQTNATLMQERIEATLKSRQEVAHGELNNLLEPLKITLTDYREQLSKIEASRNTDYGSLHQHLESMAGDQRRLRNETQNLVNSLRQPQVRGLWGELQLDQVIKLAGMSDLCDYKNQGSITTDEGKRQRPDLQVRLPNNRCIVIDSKVPLAAYLDAHAASDEDTRISKLVDHARQVRKHVDDLARKDYQKSIEGTYDFVVLFIPGEVFYNAALEHDCDLLEYAFKKNIILANPGTLIVLLKAVALGWNETRLAENAQKIKDIGTEMYKRLSILAGHLASVGTQLTKTTESYNAAIGSLETQLLVSARRMHDLQVGDLPITAPASVDNSARLLTKPELTRSAEISQPNQINHVP